VRQKGCQIAIDDFGTGYSNFYYLTRLPVDYLKIDGSLIKNIDQDDNSRIIVKNIVTFARQMGMETIAEYVHSKEVFEEVKRLNIGYSQGYYFGEPRPADAKHVP
jgi:EAL domain-containing protein (putative c-di-GMP-specific phosphodiesterase class I)